MPASSPRISRSLFCGLGALHQSHRQLYRMKRQGPKHSYRRAGDVTDVQTDRDTSVLAAGPRRTGRPGGTPDGVPLPPKHRKRGCGKKGAVGEMTRFLTLCHTSVSVIYNTLKRKRIPHTGILTVSFLLGALPVKNAHHFLRPRLGLVATYALMGLLLAQAPANMALTFRVHAHQCCRIVRSLQSTRDVKLMRACTHTYMHAACMYVFVYARMHVCMHACMHACMCALTHTHTCMYACMHVCMCACMQACTHDCIRLHDWTLSHIGAQVFSCECAHACIFASIHVHMYACMRVCMCACIMDLCMCSYAHMRIDMCVCRCSVYAACAWHVCSLCTS